MVICHICVGHGRLAVPRLSRRPSRRLSAVDEDFRSGKFLIPLFRAPDCAGMISGQRSTQAGSQDGKIGVEPAALATASREDCLLDDLKAKLELDDARVSEPV